MPYFWIWKAFKNVAIIFQFIGTLSPPLNLSPQESTYTYMLVRSLFGSNFEDFDEIFVAK